MKCFPYCGQKQDWFDEQGNVRKDLNVHDKNIPCFIRLGFVNPHLSPCSMCIYANACGEDATDEKMDKIIKAYPKMFDGTIQTREQYEVYVRSGGG